MYSIIQGGPGFNFYESKFSLSLLGPFSIGRNVKNLEPPTWFATAPAKNHTDSAWIASQNAYYNVGRWDVISKDMNK